MLMSGGTWGRSCKANQVNRNCTTERYLQTCFECSRKMFSNFWFYCERGRRRSVGGLTFWWFSLCSFCSLNFVAFYSLSVYDSLCSLLPDGKTSIQRHPPAAQRPGLGTDAGRGQGQEGERGQIWGIYSRLEWVSLQICSEHKNKLDI